MRLATHDTQWLNNDKGELLGIALGYDFASEHEWGIEQLKRAFGVKDSQFYMGVEDRQITIVPEQLQLIEFKHKHGYERTAKKENTAILAYTPHTPWKEGMTQSEFTKELAMRQIHFWSNNNLSTAWCEQDFGIMVRGEDNISKLKELFEAFKRKDIAIAPGKNRGFLRSHGLTFIILSKLEKEVFEAVLEADKDYKALQKAAEATGIHKRLDAAKRRYYACSPRWKDETKTEVVFWLNPQEQNQNNYGWFTVQDLDDWIEGKGKIPKA